jgi:Lrp/AsnC family transcriptional regulator, regulator for asnA, asnC and gidA
MSPQLDALDAKIIVMLQADGRRPSIEMARSLGVTEGTIRKRIERLVRDKIIQISAWADPLQIGYNNYAVLMMNLDLKHLDSGADKISRMPEVFFLGTCIGEFNLFVSACFRSLEHMHEFMTKRLARVPGVRRISTSHVTRVVKRDYSFTVIPTDVSRPLRRRSSAANRRGNGSTDTPPPTPSPQRHTNHQLNEAADHD